MLSYKSLIALTFAIAMAGAASAQCTVSNATISNISRTGTGSNCTLKFDLDFTMQNNNGNKTIAIHLWPSASYPNYSYATKPPNSTDLAAAYGSIVIKNDVTPPTLYATYPFGSTTNILAVDNITRTGGTGSNAFQFHLGGVTVPNVACTGSVNILGDVWSTNAGSLNANTNPQCFTKNLNLVVGDPSLSTPIIACNPPRSLSFNITTDATSLITVNYSIYRDDNVFVNGQPTFDAGADVNVTSGGSSVPVQISASQPYNATGITFTGNTTVVDNSMYWVLVTYQPASGLPFSTAKLAGNSCASTLPVTFGSFTAARNRDKVQLTWETLTETNNRGFYIQRRIGSEEWKNLAFMFSLADKNGNSNSALKYSISDLNTSNSVSQYRIQQIDLDYKASYSEIRTVKALNDKSSTTLVFPNPTATGTVNLVFDGQSTTRQIDVFDMNGRAIKSIARFADANLTITDLNPGVYSIRITNLANATTTVEKVVVTKR